MENQIINFYYSDYGGSEVVGSSYYRKNIGAQFTHLHIPSLQTIVIRHNLGHSNVHTYPLSVFSNKFLLLLSDTSSPVEVSKNIKHVCETDGQVTNTGKFEKLILCENTGSFSTIPSQLPICRDAIECGLPPTPPDANKLQYADAGPDSSRCQSDDCVLKSKVMRVGNDTFSDPFIQKVIQNKLSTPIIGILRCGLVKKCHNLTFKVNFLCHF